MNKIIYKDNKFELAIDNTRVYLSIDASRYELSNHSDKSLCIKSQDGAVDIIIHNTFDLKVMISNLGEWNCSDISPLQFCEIIKSEILKDRSQKKRQIVKETGYKTAYKDNYIGTQINFHGIKCKISSIYDESHYRLIAINGTIEQLQSDKSFTEYHEWGAIALPIICPCCNKVTWFDDIDIPSGVKYEVLCDNCNTLIIRKK